MRPSSTPREHLAAAQVQLMRALVAGEPAPAGFDPAGIAAEAKTLASKRRASVGKARRAMTRALGPHFGEYFAAYAKACARPARIADDADAFARWFHARLAEDDVLERIEWHVGLRALIAASAAGTEGKAELAPDVKADLDQLQELLDVVRARRGPRATEEPRLKTALLLASLRTLGVELDASRLATLRRELIEALAVSRAASDPSTIRDAALGVLRTNLAIERVLSRHLTVEQRERYQAHTGSDPFFDQAVPRHILAGRSPEALAEQLASHWARVFELVTPSALVPAHGIARRWCCEVASLGSTALPGTAARREASFERAVRLLEIQGQAEQDLAAHPGLCATERRRVEQRAGSFVLEMVDRGGV
jgi:hypothetical protein